MSRIEVTNLDRWVVRFLRGKRYEFQIEFGRNREAWQRALDLKPPELDLSDSFYEDEWEQVIQAKGVVREQEYRVVSRVGRGTRLGRGTRVRVWPVFEEYRAQLAERGLKEVDDAYRGRRLTARRRRCRQRLCRRRRGRSAGHGGSGFFADSSHRSRGT